MGFNNKNLVFILLLLLIVGCAGISGRQSGRISGREDLAQIARAAIGDFSQGLPEEQLQANKQENWWQVFMPRVLAVFLGGLLLKNFIPIEKNDQDS